MDPIVLEISPAGPSEWFTLLRDTANIGDSFIFPIFNVKRADGQSAQQNMEAELVLEDIAFDKDVPEKIKAFKVQLFLVTPTIENNRKFSLGKYIIHDQFMGRYGTAGTKT